MESKKSPIANLTNTAQIKDELFTEGLARSSPAELTMYKPAPNIITGSNHRCSKLCMAFE
jgi:hypothetical protein